MLCATFSGTVEVCNGCVGVLKACEELVFADTDTFLTGIESDGKEVQYDICYKHVQICLGHLHKLVSLA